MHQALRSSLPFVAIVAIVGTTALAGCQTHDRRMYNNHRDKNLHSPDPWAPSTSKAAEDATSPIGLPTTPPDTGNPVAPGSPPAPANP